MIDPSTGPANQQALPYLDNPVLTVRAPGKVNLMLDVLGKRGDGFHDLRSLMITVGLCDELHLEKIEHHQIQVVCDDPQVPAQDENLVYRAAAMLAECMSCDEGCRVRIDKHIPVGGGMGGGSSDAAAVLLGLKRHWDLPLTARQFQELGAQLGSDVPFFFHQPCAIVSGRGEIITPARLTWQGWLVLVTGGSGVSTGAVYARWLPEKLRTIRPEIESLLEVSCAQQLRPLLRNDLEQAVFDVSPDVKRVHDAVCDLTGLDFRVSGAGSVLFQVFDEESEARTLQEQLARSQLECQVKCVRAPFSTTMTTRGVC